MATVMITGGTGMIGRQLSQVLVAKGYDVVILTRKLKQGQPVTGQLRYCEWDIEKQTIDRKEVALADYIINLAGEGIADKRLTEKRKKQIVDSRVHSGNFLVKLLKENANQVRAVVSASAIGWYGPDEKNGEAIKAFVETDPPGNDFLAQTCVQWEASVDPIQDLGKRLVKLRTGIVLSKSGGALKEFEKPLHIGFSTIFGNGKQVVSWIHIDDLVNLYIHALEDENMYGVYNAVGPAPVTNRELMLTLGKIMNPHFFIPFRIPAFILKAALGELSEEILKSTTVSAKKALGSNFLFLFNNIKDALTDLEKNK